MGTPGSFHEVLPSKTWSRELDPNSIRALGKEETRKELDEAR